jgi:hypothetical protein
VVEGANGQTVSIDQAAKVKRLGAMVQTLVKADSVSVAILGEDHDRPAARRDWAAHANGCV